MKKLFFLSLVLFFQQILADEVDQFAQGLENIYFFKYQVFFSSLQNNKTLENFLKSKGGEDLYNFLLSEEGIDLRNSITSGDTTIQALWKFFSSANTNQNAKDYVKKLKTTELKKINQAIKDNDPTKDLEKFVEKLQGITSNLDMLGLIELNKKIKGEWPFIKSEEEKQQEEKERKIKETLERREKEKKSDVTKRTKWEEESKRFDEELSKLDDDIKNLKTTAEKACADYEKKKNEVSNLETKINVDITLYNSDKTNKEKEYQALGKQLFSASDKETIKKRQKQIEKDIETLDEDFKKNNLENQNKLKNLKKEQDELKISCEQAKEKISVQEQKIHKLVKEKSETLHNDIVDSLSKGIVNASYWFGILNEDLMKFFTDEDIINFFDNYFENINTDKSLIDKEKATIKENIIKFFIKNNKKFTAEVTDIMIQDIRSSDQKNMRDFLQLIKNPNTEVVVTNNTFPFSKAKITKPLEKPEETPAKIPVIINFDDLIKDIPTAKELFGKEQLKYVKEALQNNIEVAKKLIACENCLNSVNTMTLDQLAELTSRIQSGVFDDFDQNQIELELDSIKEW